MSDAARPSPDTLATAVWRAIRADILAGRLAPGARLKVQELGPRYGAGPAPVREALAQLAAEGLAVRLEQRGFRVAAADPSHFTDLIRTRCLLEGLALREAIGRGDHAWEDRVAGAERRLARLPRSLGTARFDPNPDWEAAHREFHRALIAACDSPRLLGFCERLREEADRYRALAGPAAYPARDVEAEHAAIAQASLDRDADRAVALLQGHFEGTGRFLRSALGVRAPGEAEATPGRTDTDAAA